MREPLRLTLTAAPARLPVELGEVRAQLRLDDDQILEDALVAGMLRASVEACERFTGRALIAQTWTLVRDRWPGGSDDLPISEGWVEGPDLQPTVRALMLPRPPLRSVVHVKTFDENDTESIWAPVNYLVDTASQPGRLVARTGRVFPAPGRAANGIEVRFVAGYGDAPADVPMALRQGLLQLASHMFEHRGDGVRGGRAKRRSTPPARRRCGSRSWCVGFSVADSIGATGALRHRLILQAESPIADGGGGQGADPWVSAVTVATVWGRVEPLGGAERPRAMRLESHVTHRVTIRHRPGVAAGMRVLFGVRVLNIRAVVDVGERGRVLELLCEEGVAT